MTEKLPRAEQTRETLFSPGFTSRLNISADMLLVVVATAIGYAWRYRPHHAEANLRTLVWVSASLVSTWVVTAAALRHYASFA